MGQIHYFTVIDKDEFSGMVMNWRFLLLLRIVFIDFWDIEVSLDVVEDKAFHICILKFTNRLQ